MNRDSLALTWQIVPRAKMERRLRRLGLKVSLPARTRYAQLFAWDGSPRPQLVAWLQLNKTLAANLAPEAERDAHPLSRWLERQARLDLFTVATGWTFYWRNLQLPKPRTWELYARRQFAFDRLLDELLAPSRGWLLWDHQLQLLAELCLGGSRVPQQLGKRLREQQPRAVRWIAQARLPNGTTLGDIVARRTHPSDRTTVAMDAAVVARLYSVLSHGISD